MYGIADNKNKKRINVYIEEWKDKGLLTGYFGILAKNIYDRTRIKNSEILELLIHSVYIEEQNKLEEPELNIFKDVASFYYKQGQEEVNQTLPKKKKVSVISDAIFLSLLDMPNAKGYVWKQYVEAIIKYNADQIYRQCVINIQQNKENKIDDDIFQNLIKKQQNAKLCINEDKISGEVDLTLIGLNNQAKIQGISSFDNKAKCKFISVEDESTTKECQSLNGQEFFIHDWNEFYRYSKTNDSTVKYRCYGLVAGLNLPPINDGFHWCRSYIIYLPALEKEEKVDYNIVDYVRKENLPNDKCLVKEIKKAVRLLPKHIQKLLEDTEFKISNGNSCYDRKKDKIYLLQDSDKYEILHEIGHVIETKLDILHDNKYIKIQKDGLENINPITNIEKIQGYGKNDFVINTGKFISEYQRRVYEEDIDGNSLINYDNNFTFNTKTLGEYFSEGFRCYFENNGLLKNKDIKLFNYIEGVLNE